MVPAASVVHVIGLDVLQVKPVPLATSVDSIVPTVTTAVAEPVEFAESVAVAVKVCVPAVVNVCVNPPPEGPE